MFLPTYIYIYIIYISFGIYFIYYCFFLLCCARSSSRLVLVPFQYNVLTVVELFFFVPNFILSFTYIIVFHISSSFFYFWFLKFRYLYFFLLYITAYVSFLLSFVPSFPKPIRSIQHVFGWTTSVPFLPVPKLISEVSSSFF